MRTTRPMHLVTFGTGLTRFILNRVAITRFFQNLVERPLFEGIMHYSSTLNYPKPIMIDAEVVK